MVIHASVQIEVTLLERKHGLVRGIWVVRQGLDLASIVTAMLLINEICYPSQVTTKAYTYIRENPCLRIRINSASCTQVQSQINLALNA